MLLKIYTLSVYFYYLKSSERCVALKNKCVQNAFTSKIIAQNVIINVLRKQKFIIIVQNMKNITLASKQNY